MLDFYQNSIKNPQKPISCGLKFLLIMNEGIVKFFNQTKGFGFIREENSGTEYFVHATGLIDKVRENDRVNFELKEGRKGLNAVNVKLIQE